MKFKTIIFALSISGCSVFYVYSLDWKSLHEAVDNVTIFQERGTVKGGTESVEDLYTLALIYLDQYRNEEADSLFSKILGVSPDTIEAEWGRAEVLRRKYEFEKSQNLLKEVIKKRPEFSPAYVSLAYIKYYLKDYREVVKLSSYVIGQEREGADIGSLARAYLIFAGAKGMIAHNGGPIVKMIHGLKILPNLKKAQELLPDSADVYLGLGAFYLLAPPIAGGDIERAEEHLKKAVELDDNLIEAYVRLAQVYRAKGDLEGFNTYLATALEKDPRNFLANDIKDKSCNFICIETK